MTTTGEPLPAGFPRGGPEGIVCTQGGTSGVPNPGGEAAGRDTLHDNAGVSHQSSALLRSVLPLSSQPSFASSPAPDSVLLSHSAKYGEPGAVATVTPNFLMPPPGATSSPPKVLCLPPAIVESLLGGSAETFASDDCPFRLTTMDPHDPTVQAAVSEVVRQTGLRYPGYSTPPVIALMALELGRRNHGRLDVERAVLLFRPIGNFVPSSLGLTTRLTLSPLALDRFLATSLLGDNPVFEFSKLQLDHEDPSTKEAMLLIVDAARHQFPKSVLSAPTVYYALMYSRTTNPDARLDLHSAFDALQVLSFIDAPPGENDWDFASINALEAQENADAAAARAAAAQTTPPGDAPVSPRRRITPVPVPGWRSSSSGPPPLDGSALSSITPRREVDTPPLPSSWLEPSPSVIPTRERKVSFQDLGYRYRVGTKRPLDTLPLDAADSPAALLPGGDHRTNDDEYGNLDEDENFDADDIGDEDSDASSDTDDDASDDSADSASTRVSSTSHRKRSARRSTTTQTLDLIKTLIQNMNSGNKNASTAMLAKPPELWLLGEAPKGGYFLETFTRLYGLYKAFTNISGEDCGLSFKNLITEDIEPTIRSRLKLKEKEWNRISSSELITALKSNLGFKDKDYYLARLEEMQLPPNSASEDKIFNAFVQQTSQMLAIEAEGIRTGVKLRRPTVKNIFNNYVRRHYRLSQWFHERSFKSLSRTVAHISKQFKKRHVQDKRKSHEKRQDAIVNGARSDFRGGKVEPGGAADSRDAANRKRGISKDPRGGPRGNHLSRGSSRGGGRDASTQPRGDRGGRGSPRGGGGSRPSGRPDLREAYAAEDSMDKGRFWHEKGPFCKSDTCRARVCQGCNYHSSADDPGHDRPHCPHSEHKDYVAAPKYFHDVWPGRKTSLVSPGKTSAAGSARANHSSHRKENPPEDS